MAAASEFLSFYRRGREIVPVIELVPHCVICSHHTTTECSSCAEAICSVCADENNWFDGDAIICEGCADGFMARVYRDSLLENRSA